MKLDSEEMIRILEEIIRDPDTNAIIEGSQDIIEWARANEAAGLRE